MAFVYSCCFWFSLRLGGILIAIFSLIQALVAIIVLHLPAEEIDNVKKALLPWIENVSLTYIITLVTNFFEDLPTYIEYITALLSIYIMACLLFIYGALKLQNMFMIPYIILELFRLISFSFLMITGLLLLKQNTMDIGLLIGVSVIVGFILLGMFYLWICTLNLPVLINEMKEDEQAALIEKLQKVAEKNYTRTIYDSSNTFYEEDNNKVFNHNDVFVIGRNNLLSRPPQYNVTMNSAYK